MAIYPSSPKPVSPYTKKQMYSSGAKGLLYSLAYGMNMDNTAFHSYKIEDNGNQELRPKRPDTCYYKLTVCRIYRPQNRERNGCTQWAGTQSNQRGSWPSQKGNFIWWPLLNVWNVKKYYPETTETPKGHMNQTCKNVRSTKVMEKCNTTALKGKKCRDIGIYVTMSERQYSPIRQANSPNNHNRDTNTLW